MVTSKLERLVGPSVYGLKNNWMENLKVRNVPLLGIRRIKKHNRNDFGVKVTILEQKQKTSRRKVLEAFWIKFKSPKMNRKEECLSMTHEISSYLSPMF